MLVQLEHILWCLACSVRNYYGGGDWWAFHRAYNDTEKCHLYFRALPCTVGVNPQRITEALAFHTEYAYNSSVFVEV